MTIGPDLELQLLELGRALDVPAGERIASTVVARLQAESRSEHRVLRAPRRRIAFVVAALVVAGGLAAAPAVADWLGLRGVEVRRFDGSAPARDGASLDLGTAVPTLRAAAEAAGFEPVVPASLGPPDAIWVDRRGAAPFISLVYVGGPLVSEFDATLTADAVLSKMAGPDTTVERLRIGDEPALWIRGVHEVAVRASDGSHVFERLRLSDDVLLVQHGRLTVRIEVPDGFDREDAVRIAASLPR